MGKNNAKTVGAAVGAAVVGAAVGAAAVALADKKNRKKLQKAVSDIREKGEQTLDEISERVQNILPATKKELKAKAKRKK